MQKKRILVLYAHPSQHRSEVNQPLFRAAQSMENVTAVDLYGEYPTYQINIDKEQQRLREHDVIIFLFPLYWYSTPSILKEWQDLVLEYGFAYGTDGTALKGKTFLCALSAGGKADAYRSQGYNHFTIRELLYPMEQMASLTGMEYLAPLTIFGSRTAKDEGRLETHIDTWKQLLSALINNDIDYERAKKVAKLNLCLEPQPSGDKA